MIRVFALILIALQFSATPAAAQWLRAESENFVVYSQSSEEKLREQAEALEDFDRLLRGLTGLTAPPSPNRLIVYMVRSYGDMARIRPVGRSVGGFYASSPEGILAVVDEGHREDWVTNLEILFHEYAHHFMMQYFPAVYPDWYVEGFAEYLQTAQITEETIEYGRYNHARASWLADRSGWLPMERLLFSDPARLRGTEVAKFYAQSWLLVHYLMRDQERRSQLADYLSSIARGEEARESFQRAFDTTPSRLQREMSRYGLRMTFSRMGRHSRSRRPAIVLTRLDGVPHDLVLADASLVAGRTSDGDALLRRIRSAANGRSDAFSRRVAARAEALLGDPAAADRLLDPMIEAEPSNAELLYLKGMRHLRAGRADAARRAEHFGEAQRWFARAHQADGFHFQTLYRYAESLALDEAFVSENTTNVLLLANQIAPQVREIALSAANLLIRRGAFDEAEAILAPLANSSHRRRTAGITETLLERARARNSHDVPDVFNHPEPTEED